MAFNIPPKVLGETLNYAFFIYTSCLQPLVLIISPNTLSKIWW